MQSADVGVVQFLGGKRANNFEDTNKANVSYREDKSWKPLARHPKDTDSPTEALACDAGGTEDL